MKNELLRFKTPRHEVKSTFSKIFGQLKNLDMFAHPVYLTFQGSDKFKTSIGAFLTIFCLTLVMLYSGFRFLPLFNSQNTTLT